MRLVRQSFSSFFIDDEWSLRRVRSSIVRKSQRITASSRVRSRSARETREARHILAPFVLCPCEDLLLASSTSFAISVVIFSKVTPLALPTNLFSARPSSRIFTNVKAHDDRTTKRMAKVARLDDNLPGLVSVHGKDLIKISLLCQKCVYFKFRHVSSRRVVLYPFLACTVQKVRVAIRYTVRAEIDTELV